MTQLPPLLCYYCLALRKKLGYGKVNEAETIKDGNACCYGCV